MRGFQQGLRAAIAMTCAGMLPLVCGCGPKPVGQGAAAPEDEATLHRLVRDSTLVWMPSGHIPGVAIALVRDGHVAWFEELGHTKGEGGAAIDSNTVFEAASLGKPLFAYGVMRLVSRGVIELDAPLGRYLPDQIRGVARDSGVTVARVLSHTSGLDVNEKGDGFQLAFAPGSQWRYSGAAYVLLQRAIEHVTGKPLDAWMRSEVLDSLGMTHTWYGTEPVTAKDAQMASGHDRGGEPLPSTSWPQANAASSLRTTVADYAKFMVAAMRLVNADMWNPRAVVDPAHDVLAGLGWEISGAAGPVFFHWGSNPGFKSLAIGVPEQGDACVILTNADNGLELADVIAPRLLRRDIPALGFAMVHPTD